VVGLPLIVFVFVFAVGAAGVVGIVAEVVVESEAGRTWHLTYGWKGLRVWGEVR
jgi:uncharacterized membrane protein HdeD (DUF308 family)